MIEQTKFLGMPLRTQSQRRLLVGLYYFFVLSFIVLGARKSHGNLPASLIPQTILIGGLLGGIKIGGPVKPYSGAPVDGPQPFTLLNLSPSTKVHRIWSGLDERETMQRDRAHFQAYRLLLISMFLLGLAGIFVEIWGPTLFNGRMPVLLWGVLVYAMSLPQSVLLWTEPDIAPE
jgi:hypothetical protein